MARGVTICRETRREVSRPKEFHLGSSSVLASDGSWRYRYKPVRTGQLSLIVTMDQHIDMKQSYSRRRTPQLLLLALLLLVQVGLFAHQLEHALGGDQAHCALCVAADHLGHAPVSAFVFAGVACIYLLLSVTLSTILLPRRAHVLRGARAPPRFSSL